MSSITECNFVDGVCSRCCHRLPCGVFDARRRCEKPCDFFGAPVSCLQLPITVKCTCGAQGEKEQHFPVHRCTKHKRCLPTFHPVGEQIEKWKARKPESDIYQVCALCPDNPRNQQIGEPIRATYNGRD